MRRRAAAMMNLVTIGLVLSTLAAAGVWSPAPPPPQAPTVQKQPQHGGDHVVREGRRVVIVEYEREVDGSLTEKRVLASHPIDDEGADGARVLDEARGVVSEAADERLVSDAKDKEGGGVMGAVKRCKDKICGVGRKAEEVAKHAAWSVEHGTEEAKETVEDAMDSAENKAFDAAQRGKETVESARDKASRGKETVKGATGKVSEAAGNAKESAKGKVTEAAEKAKEKVSDLEHGAAQAAKNAKDKVSEAARNVKHGAEDTVRGARDKASHVASRAEEYAHDAAEDAELAVKAKAGEVRRNLTDIARRARDVADDAGAYVLHLGGPTAEAARTATAAMHLLGFATAFGSSVWVTFLSSYVLAAALPRHQLGVVQSKMYPVYFRAVAYGVGLALAAHLLGVERSSFASRAQSVNLLAALGLVLANMMILEPKATKVMFERTKVEKEEGRGQDMADIVDPPAVTVATTATYAAAAARAEAAVARTPTDTATGRTSAAPATATTKATKGDAEMSKSRVLALNKQLKTLNSYSSLCNVLSLMALSWHLVHLARRLLHGAAC
ncbi:hypothetical protein QOZ80_4BG0348430 [Eleusine coracana subsp. coracana]|nr:hypothetical protein QOZ80_4BG0348430 [Eleusine coracana subsp. coracana]